MAERVKKVDFSRLFQKQLHKAPVKVRAAFLERYQIFLDEPFNPQLNNHRLIGRLSEYRSINITGDFRALYSELTDENGNEVIVFKMFGTHSQLYK